MAKCQQLVVGSDFATHGVDFEGSRKWVDFWRALGAQKSRWMLALGRQRGAKNATRVGQALGEGVLFEKMAPRARLARAFIINKYITYRGGCSNTPMA